MILPVLLACGLLGTRRHRAEQCTNSSSSILSGRPDTHACRDAACCPLVVSLLVSGMNYPTTPASHAWPTRITHHGTGRVTPRWCVHRWHVWPANHTEWTDLWVYAMDTLLHESLLVSPHRTFDPEEVSV